MTGFEPSTSSKHELAGCYSRRIDRKHLLVYQAMEKEFRLLTQNTELLQI